MSGVYRTSQYIVASSDGWRAYLDREHIAFSDSSSEFDDRLKILDLRFDGGIEVFLSNGGEREEVDGSNVGTDVHGGRVGREERSQSLVDVFGEERNEGRLFDEQSALELAGRDRVRTRVRARVKSVSKRVWRAAIVSSGPFPPLSRSRLNRMYQFVSSSINSNIRAVTVYSR